MRPKSPKEKLNDMLDLLFGNRHIEPDAMVKAYKFLKKKGIKKHVGKMSQKEATEALAKLGSY